MNNLYISKISLETLILTLKLEKTLNWIFLLAYFANFFVRDFFNKKIMS